MARAAQQLRRFLGEDESTQDLREIEGWIGVYAELAEFCERALAESDKRSRPPLRAWRRHFDERLHVWTRRRDELQTG